LEKAVDYCEAKKCRGYAATATGNFQLIKNPRTINKRLDSLDDSIVTGQGKIHLRVLTFEEASFVNYLLNKNR